MPLSEEEQRILHEMERKLYEHDRAFVERVSAEIRRHHLGKATRWALLGFLSGFVLLLAAFRSSVLLGTLGFLVMVACALLFAHGVREAGSPLVERLGHALHRRASGERGGLRRLGSRFRRDA